MRLVDSLHIGMRHRMHPTTCQVLREYNDLSILATFPGETWDEEAVYVRFFH